MSLLDYLKSSGLTVEVVLDKLRVSPAELITLEIKQYILTNKSALLTELTSADDKADPIEQLPPVDDGVSTLTTITEQPHTAVTTSLGWVHARDKYLGHLMGCRLSDVDTGRCCHAPTNRYCAIGAVLRQQYNDTPKEPASW